MKSDSIIINNLSKKFTFPVKNASSGWIKNLFHPERKDIMAVDNISFSIKSGERVAFIGPNGAGKSTTIKMLTGILFPTSGQVSVLGLDPVKDRKKLAYQIGTVFGQRSQLLPNLKNSVLFLEDDDTSNPLLFDRDLQSLIHLPDFKGVKGIVIGRFQKASEMTNEKLIKIIKTKLELKKIPVIANVDFGHTSPIITFPIGGEVSMDARKKSIVINKH